MLAAFLCLFLMPPAPPAQAAAAPDQGLIERLVDKAVERQLQKVADDLKATKPDDLIKLAADPGDKKGSVIIAAAIAAFVHAVIIRAIETSLETMLLIFLGHWLAAHWVWLAVILAALLLFTLGGGFVGGFIGGKVRKAAS